MSLASVVPAFGIQEYLAALDDSRACLFFCMIELISHDAEVTLEVLASWEEFLALIILDFGVIAGLGIEGSMGIVLGSWGVVE